MPKSRQKSDAKSTNEEQEEVTVVDKAVGRNPGGSQSGREKRPD